MVRGAPGAGSVDEVQIFDAGDVLQGRETPGEIADLMGMATSPNCEITVSRTPPGGVTQVAVDPDADLILFILRGACRVDGTADGQPLGVNQGVLVPAGAQFHATSTGDEDLVLLSMRTGSATERPGYVPNMPSGVMIKVPAAEIAADGIGRHLYVFAMNQRTIGIGVNATEEWNLGSLLRMNCRYEQVGDDILVNLPERMARWYQVRNLTESDYRIIPDPERNRVRVDLSPLIEREANQRGI